MGCDWSGVVLCLLLRGSVSSSRGLVFLVFSLVKAVPLCRLFASATVVSLCGVIGRGGVKQVLQN